MSPIFCVVALIEKSNYKSKKVDISSPSANLNFAAAQIISKKLLYPPLVKNLLTNNCLMLIFTGFFFFFFFFSCFYLIYSLAVSWKIFSTDGQINFDDFGNQID